jgi:hypothetical protein
LTGEDGSLDLPLELDGVTIDVAEGYQARFSARSVPPTEARPHGLDYSLTLHDSSGKRVLGFDTAHPVSIGSGPARRRSVRRDHRHRRGIVHAYSYTDASTLVADFWRDVYDYLADKGVT